MSDLYSYIKDKLCKLRMFYSQHTTSIIFGLMSLYKVTVDILYIFVVSPLYAYEGMIFQASGFKYLISWVYYIILIILTPNKKKNIRSVFLHLQLIITIVPMLTVYALADKSTLYMSVVFLVLLVQIYILRDTKKPIITFSVSGLKRYVLPFLWILTIGTYILIIVYGGFFGTKAFDLKYLYSIRESAFFPSWLSYMIGWLTGVIMPFLLLKSLSERKFFSAGLVILLTIMSYMTLGNKSIYLSLVVLIGMYIVVKLDLFHISIYTGMSGVCGCLTLFYLLEKSSGVKSLTGIATALVGERFLFIPAVNKFVHYECFSEFPKVFFSDGLLGKIFGLTYPYKGSIGQSIYAYMNEGGLYESNSNTGYLGESYAQAGFLGIIIVGILVALFIKLLECIGNNVDDSILIPLIALLAVLLNDGAFISIFMSSGWALLCVILMADHSDSEQTINRGRIE